MSNNLKCEIVSDLLPLYVDNLTSDATNQAVKEHIEQCEVCAKRLQDMQEPQATENINDREIDFLKKVRVRNRRNVLIAAGVALFLAVILFVRVFIIGNNTSIAVFDYDVKFEGDKLIFGGYMYDKSLSYVRTSYSEENGVLTLNVYTAPDTFFNSQKIYDEYTCKGEINKVCVGDKVIWENGKRIDIRTSLAYAAKHPYVGNMSANIELANALGIHELMGNFTNKLYTSQEPYGWKLIMNNEYFSEDETIITERMKNYSCVLIALIDNLGYVTWEYKTENGTTEYTITQEQANELAGEDIKKCAASAADLQKFMDKLSFGF